MIFFGNILDISKNGYLIDKKGSFDAGKTLRFVWIQINNVNVTLFKLASKKVLKSVVASSYSYQLRFAVISTIYMYPSFLS